MKKLILLLVTMTLCFGSASAGTKVLERSAKKAPAWVNTAVPGQEIVCVQSSSLAKAQQDALVEISHRIIRAIAQNVSVNDTNISSEVVSNGNVDSKDQYTRFSTIAAANLPFVNGISLSKAKDIYWERVLDKESKKEYYNYWVEYPFSSLDLNDLIIDFEKLDAQKTAEYNSLESKIAGVESVEQIGESITRLEALKEYFFDRSRQVQTAGLIKRYKSLYNMIFVEGDFSGQSVYTCHLSLNGNAISTSMPPVVTSKCARIQKIHQTGKNWELTYDASDCESDEINTLDLKFRLPDKVIKYTATIPTSDSESGRFSVAPEGTIVLAADSASADSRMVAGITLRLTLNNRGGTDFAVKSLDLNVPELMPHIVLDDIDAIFTTSGITQLKLKIDGTFLVKQEQNSGFNLVNGYIVLANPLTGSLEKKKVALPYTVNWHE